MGRGGLPYGVTDFLRHKRASGIYKDNADQPIRCSHDNPMIKKLYKELPGEPGSKKAHHLLHTHYEHKPVYLK
ncbi:MAG: hypothetical protein GX846_10050 [Deltaproteobacteria bacterium]|nr:hypothetical protein [Deltaproteobacteria bacterium]